MIKARKHTKSSIHIADLTTHKFRNFSCGQINTVICKDGASETWRYHVLAGIFRKHQRLVRQVYLQLVINNNWDGFMSL